MPKIDLARVPVQQLGSYPKQLRRRSPGARSSGSATRSGSLSSVSTSRASSRARQEDEGETVLKPGDAAGFKAGSGIGHCLINRGTVDAIYLEVGTRATNERVHYSDVDLIMERDRAGRRYLNRSGAPVDD